MASPAVSTPSSAGSPAALAPAPVLALKTANLSNVSIMASPSGSGTPTIMTTKEWVIPPRPKPGRKPATDTPPTKRKAQNRAAQRAFRERRAARVGELEEQLEETREEQQKRENELRLKISRLEAEVARFNGELQSWKLRCDTLDRIADYEKGEKEAALKELAYLRNGFQSTGTDAVPLPPRRNRRQEQALLQPQQSTPFVQEVEEPHQVGCGRCTATSQCACVEEVIANAASGCGKCGPDTNCECLEETLKNSAADLGVSTDLKRAHSPSMEGTVEKRARHFSRPSSPLEIDFTAQFSSHQSAPIHPSPQPLQSTARPPIESCGFCEQGTYCMCAEAAAESNAMHERERENRLAPLLNEVTPPPSDTDVESTQIKLPSLQPNHMHRPVTASAPADSCVNGPGTCKQCLSDPKSGLFCRSLAAMRASSTSAPPDGCCGGNASGGGCCKTVQTAPPSQPPPSLSCADTYKTLATHKNFDQASDELNTWLGRLHATPPHHAGRAPMEVEAASVMGVLKLFDRRFGRG
ncbi:bzip transcription factor protein [Rutstroemia sp. NJR-2017a BVV2]|nr:bzip transcription factor protein [Rutstroemia sp. NJR-2017a BVV2]